MFALGSEDSGSLGARECWLELKPLPGSLGQESVCVHLLQNMSFVFGLSCDAGITTLSVEMAGAHLPLELYEGMVARGGYLPLQDSTAKPTLTRVGSERERTHSWAEVIYGLSSENHLFLILENL